MCRPTRASSTTACVALTVRDVHRASPAMTVVGRGLAMLLVRVPVDCSAGAPNGKRKDDAQAGIRGVHAVAPAPGSTSVCRRFSGSRESRALSARNRYTVIQTCVHGSCSAIVRSSAAREIEANHRRRSPRCFSYETLLSDCALSAPWPDWPDAEPATWPGTSLA